MKPIPAADFSGAVTRLNVDEHPGGVTMVAYFTDDDGRIIRAQMLLPSGAADYLHQRLRQHARL